MNLLLHIKVPYHTIFLEKTFADLWKIKSWLRIRRPLQFFKNRQIPCKFAKFVEFAMLRKP